MPKAQIRQGSKVKVSHICEYWEKEFSKPSSLEYHRRIHTNERPFSCNLCDFSASRKGNLQAHYSKHVKEKPFKCPEVGCDFSASQKGNVASHHQLIHVREQLFSCPTCNFSCSLKGVLTRHMKTHEENPDKPFKCDLCPFKTRYWQGLQDHGIAVHSTERNPDFKCPKSEEGCKYVGKTKRHLRAHLKSHKEKTLVCPHPNCGHKTHTKSLLKNHMKIHIPASEKKYKCRICDYKSHNSSDLTTHVRIHTKETPYKCKFPGCSYESNRSCHLNKHVRTVHENIRPHKCPVFGCLFAAVERHALKKHVQSKHSNSNGDS